MQGYIPPFHLGVRQVVLLQPVVEAGSWAPKVWDAGTHANARPTHADDASHPACTEPLGYPWDTAVQVVARGCCIQPQRHPAAHPCNSMGNLCTAQADMLPLPHLTRSAAPPRSGQSWRGGAPLPAARCLSQIVCIFNKPVRSMCTKQILALNVGVPARKFGA